MPDAPPAPPPSDLRALTVAAVDLGAICHNARLLHREAGGAEMMGVVKANAYGHGAVEVTRALRREGVQRFAVATVAEGAALRTAGIDDPILVFAAPLPETLPDYARYGLDVTVSSGEVAEAVARLAATDGPLRVHLKVDTGMGRIGVAPEEVEAVVRTLDGARGVHLGGLWTHFATADSEPDTFSAVQLDRFRPLVEAFGDAFEHIHVANSAAIRRMDAIGAAFDRALVRAGIGLYGYSALPSLAEGLRPAMRFTSRVTHLKTVAPGTSISYDRRWIAERPSRIATVGAGYADGYMRKLTNRAEVGVGGRRYPVAGTVCMDMFMVDLGTPAGPGGEVAVGDEVVLFGAGGPSAMEVAAWAETIPYEVCCAVSARVPRMHTT